MRRIVLALSAIALSASSPNRPRRDEGDPSAAIHRLRAALLSRDFDGGLAESDSLVRKFPNSPELGALRVALMASSGVGLTDETEDLGLVAEAQDAADSLMLRFPASPWSEYAKGVANLERDYKLKDVLAWARGAVATQPRTEDFIALEAEAMCKMGMNKEAETFLNAQTAKGTRSANLLALEANVIVAESKGPPARSDTSAATRGLAMFKRVRALDSTNAGGFAMDGPCAKSPLTGARAAEGYPFLKRAIVLAPFGMAIHDAYWSAVLALPDRTPEQQHAEIEADIDQLLEARPNDPAMLALAIHGYERLNLPDKRKAAADRLRASFPTSVYADQIWWQGQMQAVEALAGNGLDSGMANFMTQYAENQRQTRDYVARPVHGSRAVLAAVYMQLFQSVMIPDSAVMLVRASVNADPQMIDEMGTMLAVELTERRMMNPKFDLGYARQLVYQTDTLCRLRVTNTRELEHLPSDYINDLNGCSADTHATIGWIDFKEGDLAAADKELQAAFDLEPHNGLVRMHRGALLEAQGKTADAEMLYLMGGDDEAVKRLYLTHHADSASGFDAYLSRRKADIRAQRLAEVSATRIATAGQLPRFSLDRFRGGGKGNAGGAGGRFTTDSLKGKIVVINFWGVWCGPCVMETPQVQKFYEAMKADTNVVFVTIDTRDTRQELSAFMAARKFDYPVLFDDGWAGKVHEVSAYPTTLFLDRQGRVVFRQVGRSDQPVDDFGLRIELLEGRTGPPKLDW